ncbi:MMPL family transporter [Lacticaseibacillus baoqingensis]|uniref:MMPL family transporter n=1 Tax=Lacticaseibacillus baoqingensis TaxID=2486013 RepID=A0ABW4E703_9LACO|nr:MMPL family transporter [Lacticaseibacillus baoqingensis]
MKEFTQKHYPALIAWIVIVAIAIFAMPNVSQLVRDNGAVKLPADVQSQVATRIQKKANGNKSVRTYTAVFSNGEDPITATQTHRINTKLKALHHADGLTVTTIMGPNDNAETKKQLRAKDKTTQLAQITVKKNGTIKNQVRQLRQQLKLSGLHTYVTGVDALNDDFATVTEKGIQKTEVIAVIFIFIVLILVFRSPIVPVISLLNVGVAFITSLSIVMNLAAHANFPISNFTQVFLVVVLFGIGTDYNILLYDYFKGALADGLSPLEATRQTRKHGGRTVLYSGLSVLIGFSVLWLAKFSFYQSASAVAIGVLVLLPVLLTLNMFFMATLGEKLFWPSKVADGQSSSKLWHGLSKVAIARPAIALIVVAIVVLPFVFTYNSELNFNNADEVPTSYQSKKGYLVIQDHFSKGMSAPATIYIKSKTPLDTQAKLAAIDDLTRYLQKEPGVKTVASVTQPGGSKISAMYLGDQLQTITKGLQSSQSGLAKIRQGLASANTQLSSSNSASQMAQIQQLADGSSQLQTGVQQYTAGVQQVSSATNQLASGSQQVTAGSSQVTSSTNTAASGAGQAASGAAQVANGSGQVASGASQVANGAGQLATANGQLATGASQVAQGTGTLAATLPTLSSNVQTLAAGSSQLTTQMSTLNQSVAGLQAQAKAILGLLTNSQNQALSAAAAPVVTAKANQLAQAVSQLTAGTAQLSTGIGQFNAAMPNLTNNVNDLAAGASQVAAGAAQAANGASQTANGAAKTAAGASQTSQGASQVASANQQLASGLGALAAGSQKVTAGSSQVTAGAQQVAAGANTLNSKSGALDSGASQVNAGVQTVNSQLQGMTAKLSQLGTGLDAADDGLKTIGDGSKTMQTYLTELQNSYMGKQFYLPKDQIHSKAFKPALAAYMADSHKITTLTVVFKGDPNSTQANARFKTMQTDLNAQLKHGALKDADVVIGGQTSEDNDLRALANGDFQRTATIMIIGIGIALMVVTRSLLQPMTIIGTLVAAFFASMGITRMISSHVLGDSLLSWNTPFFTFIMLMALGVDYSIFLMIRYKDDHDETNERQRILKAATAIGAVVISAAIILSGTFAALIPSGVTTLIQVALGVIIGLVILVIILPITMSGLISLIDWHNHAGDK